MSEQAKVGRKCWSYGHLGSSLQKIESRADKGAVMIVHVLSGWLASSYPIRRAFLQHISWRVSFESVINEKVLAISHEGMARLLYGCLFILPSTAVILDLKGFLINQKLFLSTSEYHHYYQVRIWNMPDFWNCHNNSLSKVYRFIWSCRVLLLSCFCRLAALVCFLAVVPFVPFPILLQQLQERKTSSQKFASLWAQCETRRVDWRLRA